AQYRCASHAFTLGFDLRYREGTLMPTAVERLLFLKLAQFDDFADFIGAHEQTELAGALLKIDSDFLKLSSASGDAFLKIEHDPSLKHDVDVIGDSFLKIARQFDVMATVGGTL